LSYDNIYELNYFTNCFSEALRIEPPVIYSSSAMLTEDCYLGKYFIKKGEQFNVNMYALHHNPLEWKEPARYIPERFEYKSEYFLTPSGKKRHPMSFSPFLGGKRVCVGKTFAEAISKIEAPLLIANFDFEFVDKKYMT
jgi:cytochrome P450